MNWPGSSYNQSNGSNSQSHGFNHHQQHQQSQNGFNNNMMQQKQQGGGQYNGMNNGSNGNNPGSNSGSYSHFSSSAPAPPQQQLFSTAGNSQNLFNNTGNNMNNSNNYGNNSNNMFQSTPGGQQSSYGGFQNQPQQQQFGQQNSNGSPMNQSTGQQHSQSNNNGGNAAVGRYLPGYLTGSSLTGSPRYNNNNSNNTYEGRSSPEHQSRDLYGSSSSTSRIDFPSSTSNSRLFGGNNSTSSSSGTAQHDSGRRESPSRSPKTSLFSNSAYGTSRSLALTPGTGNNRGGRMRQNSAGSSTGGGRENSSGSTHDYMEEDAPPTDTLDEFEDGSNVYSYGASPSNGPSATTSSNSAVVRRENVTSPISSAQQLPSSQSSSSNPTQSQTPQQIYKITIFGFLPNSSSSILSHFQYIGNVVYDSLSDSSPSSSSSSSSNNDVPVPPSGANWLIIGYDSEWAALRALRRNGEIIGGNMMIGVKWSSSSASGGGGGNNSGEGAVDTPVPVPSAPKNGLPSSSTSTTSTFGTPAKVLPASQAWILKKPNTSNGAGMMPSKSATSNRISELGRMDPKMFIENNSEVGKKEGSGGVVGTLTNLIFGF